MGDRDIRHLKAAHIDWQDGGDVRRLLPKPTYYRHRRKILAAIGVDIAIPCAAKERNTDAGGQYAMAFLWERQQSDPPPGLERAGLVAMGSGRAW